MSRPTWLHLALLFLLTFVGGVTLLLLNPSYVAIDSSSYIEPAQAMLAGEGFTDAQGEPETHRTPGYPVFIAAVFGLGGDVRTVVLIQHLIGSLTACLVWMVAVSITSSRLAGWVGAVTFVGDLSVLHHANKVLTELLFTTVFFVGTLALWKALSKQSWKLAALSGSVFGVSCLIRPISLYVWMPTIIVVFLVGQDRRKRLALAWALAFALFPMSWMTRNYVRQSSFTFSTIAGRNILVFRAAGALAGAGEGEMTDEVWKWHRILDRDADQMLEDWLGVDSSTLTRTQRMSEYSRLGLLIILEHPIGYAKYSAYAASMILFDVKPPSMAEYEMIRLPWKPNPRFVQWMIVALSRLLIAASLVGLVLLWKRDRSMAILLSLMLAYLLVVSAAPGAYRRFRVPMMPLFAVCAAVAVDEVRRLVRHRRIGE